MVIFANNCPGIVCAVLTVSFIHRIIFPSPQGGPLMLTSGRDKMAPGTSVSEQVAAAKQQAAEKELMDTEVPGTKKPCRRFNLFSRGSED